MRVEDAGFGGAVDVRAQRGLQVVAFAGVGGIAPVEDLGHRAPARPGGQHFLFDDGGGPVPLAAQPLQDVDRSDVGLDAGLGPGRNADPGAGPESDRIRGDRPDRLDGHDRRSQLGGGGLRNRLHLGGR